MLSGLDNIDWTRYRRGFNPPDIPELIRNLASEDNHIRWRSHAQIVDVIDDTYKVGSELPWVLIPFLVELLEFPSLPEKLPITDLLIQSASYSEVPNLLEAYKGKAEALKKAVGDVVKANLKQINMHEFTSSEQEDIDYLISLCPD